MGALRWKRPNYVSRIFRNKPVALLKTRKEFYQSFTQILQTCDRDKPEDSVVSTCGMGRISNDYTPGVRHAYATYLQQTHYYLKPRSLERARRGSQFGVGTITLNSVSPNGSSLCTGDQGGPLYTWKCG